MLTHPAVMALIEIALIETAITIRAVFRKMREDILRAMDKEGRLPKWDINKRI